MADPDITPPQHKTSVPYANEAVSVPDSEIKNWESWSHEDGDREDYYVKGPCPACCAEAQGHADGKPKPYPLEGQGADHQDIEAEIPPSTTIEIPVSCQCGFGHGKQDATGCGRIWSLIVSRTARP